MKTLKNKFKSFIIYTIVVFSLINMASNSIIAQTYLSDDLEVPVFEGILINNVTTKYAYWDLGEVNNINNRLDLVVGVSQKGLVNDSGSYIIGNTYKNQFNDNFNAEVESDRFLNLENYSNPITGLIFAKLSSNPATKKEVIVSRLNGELEIYSNSGGAISFSNKFKANGKVAAVGNFTSGDNLEDVAVIMDDTVKIYKNLGNGYLDSIPVYRLADVHASAVVLAQISSYTEPYRTLFNTTSNKDEIIIKQGDSVKIFLNNNSNGTSASTIIYTGSTYVGLNDFKIADFNNDGYNDLVIVEEGYGINVYKNITGTISTTASYTNINAPVFHTQSVGVGDFDKNGWNDIAVSLGDRTNLYLNNKSDSLFSQTPAEVEYNVANNNGPVTKTEVADLYNKGGLAIVYTHHFDIVATELEPDPLNDIDKLVRINASDSDAVPAPAYLFKRDVQVVDSLYHPKLMLFNRGDRDFQKYRIYKKNYSVYDYFLFDSTTSDHYIDTTEDLIYTVEEPVDPPEINLNYYVVAVDNSYKVSINSDTIGYVAFAPDCPSCPGGPDNFQVSNEEIQGNGNPKEYSLSNYPNPFNPTTNLEFGIA